MLFGRSAIGVEGRYEETNNLPSLPEDWTQAEGLSFAGAGKQNRRNIN